MLNFICAMCVIFFFGRLFAAPTSAAQGRDDKSGKLGGFNFLPALFVVCIFAVLTACGGGGGNSASAPAMPTTQLDVNSSQLGASHFCDNDGSYWFIVNRPMGFTTAVYRGTSYLSGTFVSPHVGISAVMTVTRITLSPGFSLHEGVRFGWDTSGGAIVPRRINNGNTLFLPNLRGQVFFGTRADITTLAQLCPARWLGDYINANFSRRDGMMICDYPSGASYSPDMQRVIFAAMADGFNRGIAIGESGFAFSGRYDGDNRAVGFVYDFADYGFAMRTDYARLPSKQDSAVWLDTYRFGIMPIVNDEVQFFAGVDNYRNAIFAIDTKGDISHRFGAAFGKDAKDYAIKYELRLNL